MNNSLDQEVEQASAQIAAAPTLEALDTLRVSLLGKSGLITEQLKALGKLPADQRKSHGERVNRAKETLGEAIAARRSTLEHAALAQRLASERVDVTLPGRNAGRGTLHPLTRALDRIVDVFARLGYEVADGPEIEDDWHNFGALNFPPDHPARTMHDTFWIKPDKSGDGRLLRTHTSPVQIRAMNGRPPPFRLIAPGKVYRSDSDQTHSPMFHQVEGLLVDETSTMADLKGTLRAFLRAFFDRDFEMMFKPSFLSFRRARRRCRDPLGPARWRLTLARGARLRHGASGRPCQLRHRPGALYGLCVRHGCRALGHAALRRSGPARVFRKRRAVFAAICVGWASAHQKMLANVCLGERVSWRWWAEAHPTVNRVL